MPDLLLPDIVGRFQQGQAFGDQRREQQAAIERRSRLSELAAQAYGAAPDARQGILQQAVGVDPQAGLALGKGLQGIDEQQTKELVNHARFLTSTTDPVQQQALWQRIRPSLLQRFPQMQLPEQVDDNVRQTAQALVQAYSGPTGEELKSVRVGGNGNYWAIRGGQFVDTGVPADPRYKIMEGAGGVYGVNERTLGASPVRLGGQPQAPGEVPFSVDPSLPLEVQQAIRANEGQFAAAPDGANIAIGGQLQPAPKTPSGYRRNAAGVLEMEPGGPAEVAAQAREDARAARKAAEEVKAEQKRQAVVQRQAEASSAAGDLAGAIDQLVQSPGFAALGTALGDVQINTPLIRNAAKDADAQLKNISGQVALATMSRLKALSAQGATGFGALSEKELKLLENSIATLQAEKVSNAQLASSLKTIRDKMDKITNWQPPADEVPRGTQRARNPQTGEILILVNGQWVPE